MRLKESMALDVSMELQEARAEATRLARLYQEVCWYHFETVCRNWNWPWHPTMGKSPIRLHGVRIVQHVRNGRTYEAGEYPVWYYGMIEDAPLLPPVIVHNELYHARKEIARLERLQSDIYDYAPGGVKYLELVSKTLVGKPLSSELVSEHVADDRSGEGDAHGGGHPGQLRAWGRRSRRHRRRAIVL